MNQRFLLLLFLAATTIQQAVIAQTMVGSVKIVSNFRIYLSAVFNDKVSLAFNQIEFITLARPDVFSYYRLLSGGTYKPEDISPIHVTSFRPGAAACMC